VLHFAHYTGLLELQSFTMCTVELEIVNDVVFIVQKVR